MRLTVTEAKARLTELVTRAEAGEEVILTHHGQDVARLVALRPRLNASERRALIADIRKSAARARRSGTTAARSQHFLYGDEGLPPSS